MKPEDTVIDDQSREQAPALAAGTSRPGEGPETSEVPVSVPSNVEDFEGWLRASIQPILQKDVLAKIARFEPGDLPEMIEAIREAELTCRVKGEETRLLVFGGPQETESQKGERLGTIAYYEDGRLLNMSVWLHRLRMDLEEELERYENAGVSSP